MIPILGGLVAGVAHAVTGPDHLAAVAPLAASDARRGARAGLVWGLGHALGAGLLGAAAVLLRDALPVAWLSAWSERAVGAVLVGIGLWTLRRAASAHLHAHAHAHGTRRHVHIHVHGSRAHHAHTHAAFPVGLLHGLAGGAHLFAVLPALALPLPAAAGYLFGYGAGAAAAMASFGATMGVAARTAGASLHGYRWLLGACGAAAVAVGTVWMVR